MANRTNNARFTLFQNYLRNRRTDEYRQILLHAVGRGYRLCPMSSAKREFLGNTHPVIILRHDVDHNSPGTVKLATIEAELGVASTFYFRWCTFDPKIVKEVAGLGHEVSLHFETLATYVKEQDRHLTVVTNDVQNACRGLLRQELLRFHAACGEVGVSPNLSTIASHGHPVNERLNYPNSRLVSCEWYSALGIDIEAYDPDLLGNTDAYISDSAMRHNNGFRYGQHALEIIEAGFCRIIFLTHPNHWSYSNLRRFRQAATALILGPITTTEDFGGGPLCSNPRKTSNDCGFQGARGRL